MKRPIIIVCFLLITCSLSFAQVSGYLGKRNMISASFSGMGDIGKISAIDETNGIFNWQLEGNFYRVKSTSRGLGLHYRFQQSTHNLRLGDAEYHFETSGNIINKSLFTYVYNRSFIDEAITRMHHFGFGWTFFDKGYVAPTGVYTEAELGVIYFSTNFSDEQNAAITEAQTGFAPYFNISRKKNHVLFNALILSYGFTMSINPLGIYSGIMLNGYQNLDYFADDRILYHHGIERTMETGVIMFKVGLGLLQ